MFYINVGGGQLPNLLQEVLIPVISQEQCDAKWSELDYDVISDIHVCVWDEVEQDKGSCNVSGGGVRVEVYAILIFYNFSLYY